MPRFECEAETRRTVRRTIEAPDERTAADLFRQYTGLVPESVGDNVIIGVCEGCERALFMGDAYGTDPEGVIVCAECDPGDDDLVQRISGEGEPR